MGPGISTKFAKRVFVVLMVLVVAAIALSLSR